MQVIPFKPVEKVFVSPATKLKNFKPIEKIRIKINKKLERRTDQSGELEGEVIRRDKLSFSDAVRNFFSFKWYMERIMPDVLSGNRIFDSVGEIKQYFTGKQGICLLPVTELKKLEVLSKKDMNNAIFVSDTENNAYLVKVGKRFSLFGNEEGFKIYTRPRKGFFGSRLGTAINQARSNIISTGSICALLYAIGAIQPLPAIVYPFIYTTSMFVVNLFSSANAPILADTVERSDSK